MSINDNFNNLYGNCIFYFLNDKENQVRKDKAIHKIVKLDFFMKNELTNINKLRHILEYNKHYYICENSKELRITNLQEDILDIKDIKNGKKLKSDETILLIFKEREIINLKTYLKALSSSTKYILTIINYYKHLLTSIDLLVKQNIVHNHINFDSIVVDNQFTPLISNFAFSINMSCENNPQYIAHFFTAYDPLYLEWPLEFHLISYLLTNKLNSLSRYNIENVINDVSENHTILKTFGETFVSSYKLEALDYFKKYINQSYEYILTDILNFGNTWDNYALSILFLRILIGIHRAIHKKNKFIILFMKLLVCNIHLNPLKRLSVELTTFQFNSLLDNLEPNDYKKVIHLMSA